MKKKLFALMALLICLALFALSAGVQADFGDFAGDSDYGGSDWGDSDWGDSDWGDSGYGVIGGLDDFGTVIAVVIVLGIIIVGVFGKKKGGSAPVQTTVTRTDDSALRPVSDYIANVDPGFNAAQMQGRLANLYVQLQNCWSAKDLTPLRPYLTDELYTQSDRQLDAYRNAHQTPHVDRIAVLGTNIRGWFERDGMDHLIVEMSARITVYTTDDATGNVVRGDMNAEKFMTYEWDLARSSGVKTVEEGGMQVINCPNCGAPLSINKSAKCPYCDSVITLKEHDWALFSIKGLSQRTQNN